MPPVGSQTFSLVQTPPAAPPEVGLIASLSGPYLIDDTGVQVDGSRTRWEAGFQYNPEQVCNEGYVMDPCAVTNMVIPPNPGLVQYMPFLVGTGDKCSSFGWRARDYPGRAMRALIASESELIAQEMWTGARAKASGWPNMYLASPQAQVLSSTPQTAAAGLAILEQGIASSSNGQRGMIHCTRQVGMAWSELGNTLRTAGGLIITYCGTVIVPDAGYDGSGPSGAAASTTQWAYGTQMVTVRRSPIEVIPEDFAHAMLPSTGSQPNMLEFRAERYAAATFPPCTLVACEMSVPVPAGGAS